MKLGILPTTMRGSGLIKRYFHCTRTLSMNPNNVTEVRIPVPWGHIAGKWWGSTSEQPILALHGWQDNASSFDPLLELLPDTTPVLALDSPGHGFSSHNPPGMLYHKYNYIMLIRKIQQYFKWDKKMTILGHSEGGFIGFLFSTIYPEFVNSLIVIDAIKPIVRGPSHLSKMGQSIDMCITTAGRDARGNPKYSLQEIEKRWIEGTRGSLTAEAVKILLKRGATLDDSGKYSLTRDPILRLFTIPRVEETQSLEFARGLKCHYLLLKCQNSYWTEKSHKSSTSFLNIIRESAKSFKVVTIEGTHHAHLSNPEKFAPVISEFIENVA